MLACCCSARRIISLTTEKSKFLYWELYYFSPVKEPLLDPVIICRLKIKKNTHKDPAAFPMVHSASW